MAFQPATNCAEVVVEGSQAGQQVVNTYYFRKDAAYTQEDIDNLALAVDTWVGAVMLPLVSNQYSYIRTRVRGLTSAVDLASENNTSAGSGEQTGDSFPNNVALSVKRRSAFTGRAARGRVYWPGMTVNQVELSTNTVTDAFVTLVLAALDALTEAAGEADWEAVILHRVSGGTPLAAAVIYTLVEWVVVDKVLDSMRRRLPARGV